MLYTSTTQGIKMLAQLSQFNLERRFEYPERSTKEKIEIYIPRWRIAAHSSSKEIDHIQSILERTFPRSVHSGNVLTVG